MSIVKHLFLLLMVLCASSLQSQEICNDAIDNDADGLIDLNDPDCICESIVPSGLIPNPSFEERSCCPTNKQQLYCANSWEQASGATTDYVHSCDGFLGHNSIPNADAPLPFPDGEGAVGFRDGEGNFSTNYKEYTASDLLEKMKIGTTYRFDFFVGFPNRPQHPSLEIAVFATTNKNAIPFGGNNNAFGCPTNGQNFDLIGTQKVSGNYEWVNVVFEFVADKAYEAIVLGPGCAINPTANQSPYFFLDRLALAEVSEFGLPFANIIGEVCNNNLVLTAEEEFSYQWYLDGVAIIGEEKRTLELDADAEEGHYSVLMRSPTGCSLSEKYNLQHPIFRSDQSIDLCVGESYTFGTQIIIDAGVYTETFKVGIACDSIVILTVDIEEPTNSSLDLDICPGDSLIVGSTVFTEAGSYTTVISNKAGCDSTISLELSLLENIERIELEDTVHTQLGETIELEPNYVSPDAVRFEWFNNGELLSSEYALSALKPITTSSYQLKAYTENNCFTKREVVVVVDNTVRLYVPNFLSEKLLAPDNRFFIGTNPAIDKIHELVIFDRWGSPVHTYSGTIENYKGWDGHHNNTRVEQGVYVYYVELEVLDGRRLLESGSLTVIR